jgi:hypothetical protein
MKNKSGTAKRFLGARVLVRARRRRESPIDAARLDQEHRVQEAEIVPGRRGHKLGEKRRAEGGERRAGKHTRFARRQRQGPVARRDLLVIHPERVDDGSVAQTIRAVAGRGWRRLVDGRGWFVTARTTTRRMPRSLSRNCFAQAKIRANQHDQHQEVKDGRSEHNTHAWPPACVSYRSTDSHIVAARDASVKAAGR